MNSKFVRYTFGLFVALGLAAALSYLSTAKNAMGDFPSMHLDLEVRDAATQAPIEPAVVSGVCDGALSDAFELPRGNATGDDGRAIIVTPEVFFERNGWDIFWLFFIGTTKPSCAVHIEAGGYRRATLTLLKISDLYPMVGDLTNMVIDVKTTAMLVGNR